MKRKILIMLTAGLLLTSCSNSKRHDGLILTDHNTGKKYLLEHNLGGTYFIKEAVPVVVNGDTTYVFRY